MRTLRVDIEGLDLVLGGGVPILKRHESFAGESATIVVRGPSGAGKTVIGTQLATSLARTLGVDVAYACIELLPSELAAQHAGLGRPNAASRVVQPPFPRDARTGVECRIYAGVLDLGTPSDEQARLVHAIDELLGAVREVGGKPGVLVVDSLSDGYHLGGSVPRPLADELCKMAAQQGLILVLLEETRGSEQTEWCFAADLVLELDMGPLPGAGEVEDVLHRRVRCTKNRFGPTEPGPHHLDISPTSGVRLYPNQVAHTRPWAVGALLEGWQPGYPEWDWGVVERFSGPVIRKELGRYPFNRCVTLVFGTMPSAVAHVSAAIGAPQGPVSDVLLSFGIEPGTHDDDVREVDKLQVVAVGSLFPSDRFVAGALSALSRIWSATRPQPIGRVFIGDLRRIDQAWTWERKQQTLGTLFYFLKRARIPVILLNTNPSALVPSLSQLADVEVHARGTATPNLPEVRLVQLGVREQLTGMAPAAPISSALMLSM